MLKSDLPPSYDETLQQELQECHGASTPALMNPQFIAVSLTPRTTSIITGDSVIYTQREMCNRDCLILPLLVPLLFLAVALILYTSVEPVRRFLDEHQFVIWVPVVTFLAIYVLVVFLVRVHNIHTHM